MKEIVNIPELGIEKPAGKIKIEVFDAKTGALVQEQKKDNFVQERTLRALQQMLSRLPFSMAVYHAWGYPPSEFFNSVLLSNFAGAPEPENENFIKGWITGYGIRDQASASTDRGAFNAAESVFRGDYIKMVFDFVTSQGNGTFQSIYTARMSTDVNNRIAFVPYTAIGILPFTYNRIRKGSNFLLFENGGKFFKVDQLDFTPGSGQQLPVTYEEFAPGTASSPPTIYGYGVLGTKVYMSGWGYDWNNINVFDLSDKTLVTKKAIPFPAYYVATNPKKNHVLIERQSAPYNVHVYDANTWTEVDIITSGNNYAGLSGISEDGLFLFKGGHVIELSTGRLWFLGSSSSSSWYYDYTEMGDFSIYKGRNGGQTNLWFSTAPTFFSRALLETPVTKTNLQNMKITYEFTIPKLNIPIAQSAAVQPNHY